MPRTRPPYSPEFRQQILDLVRTGREPNELAREFEPSGETIRQWVKQAALEAGERTDGLTSVEKSELARLRKEIKNLRQEREIGRLKSAIKKPPPGSGDKKHRAIKGIAWRRMSSRRSLQIHKSVPGAISN
jgi:transposase